MSDRPEHECFLCKKQTESLAGDPLRWPTLLPYPGGNGNMREYHIGCVSKILAEHAARSASPTPKTHAEVAKKLWKRLLDADVDACNPDCDDQTRGPVAILATALREANIEGMIEMAHKYVEKGGAIPVPPGHILDDAGNVRKVLGKLPVTADGCVVGDGVQLWHPEGDDPSYETSIDAYFDDAYVTPSGDDTRGGNIPIGDLYSTKEQALHAKDAHAGE